MIPIEPRKTKKQLQEELESHLRHLLDQYEAAIADRLLDGYPDSVEASAIARQAIVDAFIVAVQTGKLP